MSNEYIYLIESRYCVSMTWKFSYLFENVFFFLGVCDNASFLVVRKRKKKLQRSQEHECMEVNQSRVENFFTYSQKISNHQNTRRLTSFSMLTISKFEYQIRSMYRESVLPLNTLLLVKLLGLVRGKNPSQMEVQIDYTHQKNLVQRNNVSK